jgi:hypothetical protein
MGVRYVHVFGDEKLEHFTQIIHDKTESDHYFPKRTIKFHVEDKPFITGSLLRRGFSFLRTFHYTLHGGSWNTSVAAGRRSAGGKGKRRRKARRERVTKLCEIHIDHSVKNRHFETGLNVSLGYSAIGVRNCVRHCVRTSVWANITYINTSLLF